MPINKKDNKKNAPQAKRDSAVVPTRDDAVMTKKPLEASEKTIPHPPVNALSTSGRKKRPSQVT